MPNEVASHIIDRLAYYSSHFKDAVSRRQIKLPLHIDGEPGMAGGDIFQYALHADPLTSSQSITGHAGYRMPVIDPYPCGSEAHLEGGGRGIPGPNAAQATAPE